MGTFEVDGYKVGVGEDVARRAEEDVFANALRVVVRGLRDYEAGSEQPVEPPMVLSVALAKLSNMSQEQLSWVSKLEDVIEPANIAVVFPGGPGKPALAFEDTPANREAYEEMAKKLGTS